MRTSRSCPCCTSTRLRAQELDTGTSIPPATPVMPQERSRANHERMQQHADLARLFGGTARAEDRGGNFECWPHRPPADFHRLPGGAHGLPRIALPGNARFHLAGEQNLDRRSDRLSRAEPPQVAHILVQEKEHETRLRVQASRQGQTRWYVPDRDEADDPVPAEDSRPIVPRPASTLVHRMTDYTSGRGPVQHPHPQERVQRHRDAGTVPPRPKP